jgi:hypothetical protein
MFQFVPILSRGVKPWLLEKPTPPFLILFDARVDVNALSMLTTVRTLVCVLYQIYHRHRRPISTLNTNQVIFGKQLVEVGGADVNARANRGQNWCFPYNACLSTRPTNPDFITLLLENGADPNMVDMYGRTSLIDCIPHSVGAGLQVLKYDGFSQPIKVNQRRFDGLTVLDLLCN